MLNLCSQVFNQPKALFNQLYEVAAPLAPVAIALGIRELGGAVYLNVANAAYSTFSGVRACCNLTKDVAGLIKDLAINGRSAINATPLVKIASETYIIYMSYYTLQYSVPQKDSYTKNAEIDFALGLGLVLGSSATFLMIYKNRKEVSTNKTIASLALATFNMYNGISILKSEPYYPQYCNNFYCSSKPLPLPKGDCNVGYTDFPFEGLRPNDSFPYHAEAYPNRANETVVALQGAGDSGTFSRDEPLFYSLYSQHKNVYFSDQISQSDDLCAHLYKAKNLFQRPIDILIPRGHGSPTSLIFTRQFVIDTANSVSAYSCINDTLASNATIVLDSCEVGGSRWFGFPNLAEWFSRVAPGRTVISSSETATSEATWYNFKNGMLNVTFKDASCNFDTTKTYRTSPAEALVDNWRLHELSDSLEQAFRREWSPFISSFGNREANLCNSISLFSREKFVKEKVDAKPKQA